jgi:hypothetical protein
MAKRNSSGSKRSKVRVERLLNPTTDDEEERRNRGKGKEVRGRS